MARLPWIQVGDAFVLAPRLAGMLGVDPCHALGLLVKLDREAIEITDANGCPTGHFRGKRAAFQVAGAVGWTADRAEELAQALADIGKADLSDGVRVLGIEWAVKAWEGQQEGAKKKAEYRAKRAAELAELERLRDVLGTSTGQTSDNQGTAGGRGADGQGKIEKESKTEIESKTPDLAGLAPDPKRPALRLTPTPKEKVRQPSKQELLAQRIAEQRAAILGGEPLPDESFGVSRLNQMLAPLLEVEEGLLSRAHALFCEDPWVRNEANPPAPLRLFAAQWSKWVALAMKQGVPA